MSSRRNLISTLGAVLALTALALIAPLYAGAAGTASIAGTVTADDGGAPLAGIAVCAYSADEEGPYEELCDFTDADGEYLIDDLAEGAYVLEFWPGESASYLGEFYDDIPFWAREPLDEVEVDEGEAVEGIDVGLTSGAEISGTVTAAGGGPIGGIEVCAWGETGGGYWPCANTNASGAYDLGGLPASNYIVEFYVPSSLPYVREFYDNQLDWGDAERVPVGVGEVVDEIDAELAEGGRIGGRITAAASGAPLDEIVVCAYETLGFPYGCTESSPNGSYQLNRLATGSYKVSFSEDSIFEEEGEFFDDGYLTQFYAGATTLAAATPVSVVAPGTTLGIDAALVSTLPAPTPPAPPAGSPSPSALLKKGPTSKKCRKGFTRKKVKGKPSKSRCVKVRKGKGKGKKRGRNARPPRAFDAGQVRPRI